VDVIQVLGARLASLEEAGEELDGTVLGLDVETSGVRLRDGGAD
jgi:hypothetical protein